MTVCESCVFARLAGACSTGDVIAGLRSLRDLILG